jgi:hypothetical protein
MKTNSGICTIILYLLTAVCAANAQQTPESPAVPWRSAAESPASTPAVFYRLDLVIRELDGEKSIDNRKYSMWVKSGTGESTTAGSEVPYPGSSYSKEGTGTTKSIQYRSVGVSIFCDVKEGSGGPQLDLKLNISDALPPAKDLDAPVFRKVSLESKALLILGKPVTVGIVEDPASRHRYQVDVTATKLN